MATKYSRSITHVTEISHDALKIRRHKGPVYMEVGDHR